MLRTKGEKNLPLSPVFKISAATGDAIAAAATCAAGAAGAGPGAGGGGSVGGDATTIKLTGVPAGVLYNAIGFSPVPATTDMKDEYVKFFSDIYAKAVPGSPFDLNVLLGMNTAFMTAQALKAAGPSPTRKSLINAINTKGATFANSALVPAAYSRTSQVGLTGYWVGKYSATGDLAPIGGSYVAYTTDSGSGAVVKSTYVRPAMPAKGLPN